MQVVGGPAANGLDEKIAKLLGLRKVNIKHKVFPDGESYIRILDNLEDEVILVQSFYPPQDKHIIEFLLLADTLRDLGVKNIIGVVPYLAYSRQDKRFLSGEAISIKTILRLIESVGVNIFITVDIHKEASLSFMNIPAYNLNPVEIIAKYLIENFSFNNPLVLSPDKGGLKRAGELAKLLSTDYDYIEKSRDRITGEVTAKPKTLEAKGRDVIIIDDIISTGGTIALATRCVKSHGARKVYVVCTHALLIGDAAKKIFNSGVDVLLATDTVPSPYSKISVAPVIINMIKTILGEKIRESG